MKQHKRLPLALFLVFALCIQTLSFTSAAAALADPEPVFSASDMTFSSGTDAVALPQSAVTQLWVVERHNHRGLHPHGDVHGQLPVQLEQQQRD